jgi:hypothetical protein
MMELMYGQMEKTKTMSNLIECTFCYWVGEEEELLTQMVDNKYNPQDHTLYEEKVCPQCKTNDGIS